MPPQNLGGRAAKTGANPARGSAWRFAPRKLPGPLGLHLTRVSNLLFRQSLPSSCPGHGFARVSRSTAQPTASHEGCPRRRASTCGAAPRSTCFCRLFFSEGGRCCCSVMGKLTRQGCPCALTGDSAVRQGVSLKAFGKLVCVRHAEAALHVVRCHARSAPGPGISVCCAGQQRVSLAVQRAMLQWAMRPFDLGRLLGKCIARRQMGVGGRCVLQCQSRTLTARWFLRVGGGGRGAAHSVPLCAGPRL